MTETEPETVAVNNNDTETATAYVVLVRMGAGWQLVGTATDHTKRRWPARSAHAAIQAAATEHLKDDLSPEPQETYVAVPARSWKPVTVRAEQTVVLKLEDAKA